jgi:hypothetical protein
LDICDKILPGLRNENHDFRYFKNNQGALATNFNTGIKYFKELRNKFSHNSTKFSTADELKSDKLCFKLEKFSAPGKNGELVDYTLKFQEQDEILLTNDVEILKNIFVKLFWTLKSNKSSVLNPKTS